MKNQWSTDYNGKCGNCHKSFHGDEKYCRYCGTKRGEGKFEPYQNLIQCIYGPVPVKRVRKCTKCTNLWETFLMIDREDYCPQCGAPSLLEPTTIENETDQLWHFGLLLENGTFVRLVQSEISIGRNPDSYIVVSNKAVSRRHALLQFLSGKWFLMDCGSLNGTALNSQHLTPQTKYELHDGDRIILNGESVLQFKKDKG